MKGAMIYVDAGKGHYTPAKAVADSFIRKGEEAILENLFLMVGSEVWNSITKDTWRFMLHIPRLEPLLTESADTRINAFLMKKLAELERNLDAFGEWYEKEKPDFILSTNFIGGAVLPVAVEKLGIDIPVYQYLADVFDTPRIGVNNSLSRMYTASEIGIRNAIAKGQDASLLSLCSFPIQHKFEAYGTRSKEEARKELGLDNKFTVLLSMGGEGIGSISLLYKLAASGQDLQVVTIGGKSESTERNTERLRKDYPDFHLETRGFVDNVPAYLAACDIQIGKAGANSVMESIYMHRPFIVTEVLYPFGASEDFLRDYPVGWCENDVDIQEEIIRQVMIDEKLRTDIEETFRNIPIHFGADAFCDQLIEETERIRKLQ